MSWPAALAPMGPEAAAVSGLIWSFTELCAIIWVLVVAGTLIALTWRHPDSPPDVSQGTERRVSWIVSSLAVVTGLIVISLTVISYAAQQRIFGLGDGAVDIDVIGHQWWWEVRYPSADPSKIVMTANELHIPVGQLVRLNLTSVDVIHSFWVPSLMGKADLVPGRHNTLAFTASKAGVYSGNCAEFCGLQHAHMGIRVFADAPADFDRWKQQQAAAALQPSTAAQTAGKTAFMSSPCASCHTVRGTDAGGNVGPDLTHVASRSTIAAGTADLSRGTLAAWITDPQNMKPGTNMPTMKIEPRDLDNLLDYLMGLK